ncbi:MAG: isoprenyl transferase [Beijerinckiaceae bacterium]|nr:isoprenyl transferase [Beijerinckiaceae bacterium]
MDGNGRWAQQRSLPRIAGHRAGVEAVRRLVRLTRERQIEVLTLYSFSTENWSRPEAEVSELMRLLRFFIRSDLADLHRNNVQVRIIGEREGLAPEIVSLLDEAESTTAANTGLKLVVAFNYGARQEMTRAVRHLAGEVAAGRLSAKDISAERISAELDTRDLPDPDLIIRTSGEQRISNFLLWQAAYAEFVFLPILWPDFDAAAYDDALGEFARRQRRFGGV